MPNMGRVLLDGTLLLEAADRGVVALGGMSHLETSSGGIIVEVDGEFTGTVVGTEMSESFNIPHLVDFGIVCLSFFDASSEQVEAAYPKWGGVAMTLLHQATQSGVNRTAIYGILNPATGPAVTIAVDYTDMPGDSGGWGILGLKNVGIGLGDPTDAVHSTQQAFILATTDTIVISLAFQEIGELLVGSVYAFENEPFAGAEMILARGWTKNGGSGGLGLRFANGLLRFDFVGNTTAALAGVSLINSFEAPAAGGGRLALLNPPSLDGGFSL